MIRKEKFTDRQEIYDILERAEILRLGMCENGLPYVVPVIFVFSRDDEVIFIHSSKKGRKIDLIATNPIVSFQTEIDFKLLPSDMICRFDIKYKSVIGLGHCSIVENKKAKFEALNLLSMKYAGRELNSNADLTKVEVLKIEIKEVTGKKSGF